MKKSRNVKTQSAPIRTKPYTVYRTKQGDLADKLLAQHYRKYNCPVVIKQGDKTIDQVAVAKLQLDWA